MIQRRTPLKRGTTKLKRTPLRKVSKKRAKDGKIYSEKRKAFLESQPVCQVWLKEAGYKMSSGVGLWILQAGLIPPAFKFMSTDIHHMAGHTGSNYLDESTWLAVCRENHERIHNNPSWARANGFLK